MPEYITKEQAIEFLKSFIPAWLWFDPEYGALRALGELTPADVVEVVRCKDCRYFTPQAGWGGGQCSYLEDRFELSEVLMFDDDYCSDGKRKDGESNV